MYHRKLIIYLMGEPCEAYNIIQTMPPMDKFSHEFVTDGDVSRANIIFANLPGADAGAALRPVISAMDRDALLIPFVEKDAFGSLADCLDRIYDVWTLPMSDAEVRFRFAGLQNDCRESAEAWQTSQFLEQTINSIPSMVWYKTKDGLHKKVNNGFCNVIGKPKDVIEGRDHCFIWDATPEEAEVCAVSDNEVMSSRKTVISEEVVQRGGDTRLLTAYKSPLYDFDGSVMGTVGIGIDITQERAYEDELLRKNSTLETIFTTLECGVLCHSLDGSRIIRVNQAALDILGYDSQEELAKGFQMVAESVHDDDKQKMRDCMKSLKKEGDSANIEYRVFHRDGELLHVMGNVKLIRENGELCYQRFLLNVTEQKTQEYENERRQNGLIQALTLNYSLVCYFDLTTGLGRTLRADEERNRLIDMAFSPNMRFAESMDHYIDTLVYPSDRETLRSALSVENIEKELRERSLFFITYRSVHDKETKFYEMQIVRSLVWDSASRIVVVGIRSVDEETRKEMEQRQLLEEALVQANRANNAKSVFLSNMSHDLRTPMNAIIGFTALSIANIDKRDAVESYLKKIMTSGNHMLSLVNDVLDMSRIESGKVHIEEESCSLPDMLHSISSMVQSSAQDKQLSLTFNTEGIESENIFCDKLRLNQVLINILSNSIKYTNPGGAVTLDVSERPGELEGMVNYDFCIRDNGVGMSEEFLNHIFEPFEREKNTTTSGVQGTGLGMAITKNIVDMMNGTIKVKSKQNVGTEVTVSFPFRLDTDAPGPQVIPDLRGARALVIDADQTTCHTIMGQLEQLGLQADGVTSGEEALHLEQNAASENNPYRVFVIDWMLDDMNVIEVARKIRDHSASEEVTLVLTSYDWSSIEEDAKTAGVSAFCSKPPLLSNLRDALCSVTKHETNHSYTGRLLVVEDNEMNQEIAEMILTDAGFDVDIAENGQIAIDKLIAGGPGYYKLILMDIQMPVMNGYEATKAIRLLGDKELASIPILAMTANAFEEDKQEALKSGMNGHIAKPINMDILFEELRKVLG